MPSHEQIEAALRNPKHLLQVIPDVKTFCEVADQEKYQSRLFSVVLKDYSLLSGVIKTLADLDTLARRYPKYNDDLYEAVIKDQKFFRYLIKHYSKLEAISGLYLVMNRFNPKADTFFNGLIDRVVSDREWFMWLFHSAEQECALQYSDQKLVCHTIRYFPEFAVELYAAEFKYTIPVIYAKAAETKNIEYLITAEQTMADMIADNVFIPDVYDDFLARAKGLLKTAQGEWQEVVSRHISYLKEHEPVELARLLASSMQRTGILLPITEQAVVSPSATSGHVPAPIKQQS